MKKITNVLLIIMLLVSCKPFQGAAIVGTPQYILDDKIVQEGDVFTMEVAIAENPGIISLRFNIVYDTDVLELQSVSNRGILNGFTTPPSIITSPYKLRWADSLATDDNTAQGTVITLTFKALQVVNSTNVTIDHVEARNTMGTKVMFENAMATVAIEEIPVDVTGVFLNKESLSLKTGESETLVATISPDNATNKVVIWESSDATVATVDNEGKVTAVKKGTAVITVTTEDGSFSDTCEVSVACSHANTTIYSANNSTCEVQGNDEYTTCDDCGIVVSGSDAKLPFADHTGGTATCKSQAICDVCNQPYGDYASHSFGAEIAEEEYLVTDANCVDKAVYYKSCFVCGLADTNTFVYGNANADNHVGGTYVDGQKEASCYEEGYTGDTKCNSCNAVITYGNVVPTSSHNPSSIWSTDEEGHWKDCGTIGCGNLIDYAKHFGGEATCVSKAVCSVCKAQYGTENVDNHKTTELRNAKEATEDGEGYTGDKYCLDCQKVVEEGTIIPKLEHIHSMNKVDADDATCTKDGNIAYWYCTKCMKYYKDADSINEIGQEDIVIPKKTHTYTVLQYDDNYHWYKCSGCSETEAKEQHTGGTATCTAKAECTACEKAYGDYAEHQLSEIVDDEYLKTVATCTESAVYYKSCSICGRADAETFSYGNVNPAAHKMSKVDAEDATHEKDGNIEYYICSDCTLLFADEDATTEITFADTVIAKGEHSYGDAYESDADNHWKVCDCGDVIEKSAHNFGDWSVTKEATETEKGTKEKICSVCEYKVTEEIPVIDIESNDGTTNDGASDKAPETGDTSNIFLWSALLILSVTTLMFTVSQRRKNVK